MQNVRSKLYNTNVRSSVVLRLEKERKIIKPIKHDLHTPVESDSLVQWSVSDCKMFAHMTILPRVPSRVETPDRDVISYRGNFIIQTETSDALSCGGLLPCVNHSKSWEVQGFTNVFGVTDVYGIQYAGSTLEWNSYCCSSSSSNTGLIHAIL